MLDLRHLRYLVAVADAASLMRAARRLGIGQPALSRQMRDLERQVGHALFVRTARGVRLTPAGERLVGHARTILAEADEALEDTRRAGRGDEGLLRVGYLEAPGFAPLLRRALERFRAKRPHTLIEFHARSSVGQWKAVAQRELDIALSFADPPSDAPLRVARVMDMPLTGVLVAPSHLPKKESPVSLRTLAKVPLTIVPRALNPSLYDLLMAALAERNVAPPLLEVGHGMAIHAAYAGSGATWALWNPAMETTLGSATHACYRDSADPPIDLWISCAWTKDQPSIDAIEFAAACKA